MGSNPPLSAIKEKLHSHSDEFAQDFGRAVEVLREVAEWLEANGKNPSEWWRPENMNREFMLGRAEPEEFYVALVRGKPAGAMILQDNERNQSWEDVDKGEKKLALYVHWLAVSRQFAGIGLPGIMLDFAQKEAQKRGFQFLRLDTSAEKKKLRKVYDDLKFSLMGVHEGVAYYQKPI